MNGLTSLIGVVLALAPDRPYSEDNLNAVIVVAEEEQMRLDGRCLRARDGALQGDAARPGIDREAEAGYARMAMMRRLVAEHFPFRDHGPAGLKAYSETVHLAVTFYELAYQCNPGWEQRRYLNDAIEMVEQRLRQIVATERRPGSEDFNKLTEDEARLRSQLEVLQREHEALSATPREEGRGPAFRLKTAPEERPRGYRKRLIDLLSLRVEVGSSIPLTIGPAMKEHTVIAFVFSLSPGVRLLAGARQRHVFGIGARYTLLAWKWSDDRERVNQMTFRFEYGIRVHPEWFSIHAGFEPGTQVHTMGEKFGYVQLGGYGSLCTWGEALCFRAGGSKNVRPSETSGFPNVAQVTLGLDVFRVVDSVLRVTEARP